jgi:hypothetical protein
MKKRPKKGKKSGEIKCICDIRSNKNIIKTIKKLKIIILRKKSQKYIVFI